MQGTRSHNGTEYKLLPGMTIISHTDAKGIITECNEDFVEASGYVREELIGKPHNILRHPDMPAEAFGDLWDTIRRGRPWSGIVKNRRKDGGYYWVRANVTPLPDGSGYTSVRILPQPGEVEAAEALYKRMREGEKIELHGGHVKTAIGSNPLNQLSIAQRLWVMVLLPAILVISLVSLGLFSLKESRDSIKTIYEDRLVPIDQIAEINDLNQMSLIDLLLAEQALDAKENAVEHLASIRKNKAEIDKAWSAYMATYLTEDEKKLAADHLTKRNTMWELIDSAASLLAAGDAEQAARIIHSSLDQVRSAQEDSIDKLKEYQVEIAQVQYKKAAAAYEKNLWLSLLLGVMGTLLTLGLAVASMRYVTATLRRTGETAMAIAKGDLTQPIPPAHEDEIGSLVSVIAIMRNSQHELIASMRQNSEALNRYASELAASASNGAEASITQSEAVSSMAAAVEQLSASIHTVEDNAQQANSATQRSAAVSSEGGRIIHETADEMGQIATAVNTTATSIKELEEMSRQISGIVNVIREIADQTNLLALNAAIEAARAGEQGRGFAVVADEVRNLAARTGASTLEIANMVARIQEGTHRAVQDMEAAVVRANEGVQLAHKAGDSVVGIRTEAEQVSIAVNEITNALREQAVASRDISDKIERVACGAETNSASATETATLAQHMEQLAHRLNVLTSYFRI